MDLEGQIEVLTRLGLTVNQAKTFIALAQLEPSTVAQIAKSANLAREVVYRTLPILQKMGLITKTISFPTRFNAISPESAIRILLKKREEETAETKTKTFELIKQLKPRLESEKENQVTSVKGRERYKIFARKQMLTAKVSMDTMMTYARFYSWWTNFGPTVKKMVAKKVKIRVLILESTGKIEHKDLIRFKGNNNFVIKFIPDKLQTFVGIIDEKDTMVNTCIGSFSGYWSNDSGIVALSRIYFDKYWNTPEIGS